MIFRAENKKRIGRAGVGNFIKPEYDNGKTDKHGQSIVEWGTFLIDCVK